MSHTGIPPLIWKPVLHIPHVLRNQGPKVIADTGKLLSFVHHGCFCINYDILTYCIKALIDYLGPALGQALARPMG